MAIEQNQHAPSVIRAIFSAERSRRIDRPSASTVHSQASPDDSAELAFAALVKRHGPMVLRVCRVALGDEHDAQDAFQAVFLVLVQKARLLRVQDSLGPWLHAVALRVSTHARVLAMKGKSTSEERGDVDTI